MSRERFADTKRYNPRLDEYLAWLSSQERLAEYHSDNAELAVELLEEDGQVCVVAIEGDWQECVELMFEAVVELEPDDILVKGRPGWIRRLQQAGFREQYTALRWRREWMT